MSSFTVAAAVAAAAIKALVSARSSGGEREQSNKKHRRLRSRSFFRDGIAIGDRHFAKRLHCDRQLKNQLSGLQKTQSFRPKFW